MLRATILLTLAVLLTITQVYSAPQFISFKEGKLGVNFGGYHAGVGLGGVLGDGTAGGLYAEAGTPHGQAAKAGLGGVAGGNGGAAGGLYAGATAGGNVRASTGLAGGVTGENSAGVGYAAAQAGDHYASSGLGGESSGQGSSGFSFSGSKSYGVSGGVIKEINVQPVQTLEEIKPVQKKVHKEFNVDAVNEIEPLPLTPVTNTKVEAKSKAQASVDVKADTQPTVIVKEVYVEPQPVPVVEKHIIHTHYKPRRHHFRKTAYIGGYIGGPDVLPPPAPVVIKTSHPVLEKRIDVGAESSANAAASASANVHGTGAGQVTYTKEVNFQRNPTFFADIFNIPISTLKAVGDFLGNAAGSTNVSVQKTATVHAGHYHYA